MSVHDPLSFLDEDVSTPATPATPAVAENPTPSEPVTPATPETPVVAAPAATATPAAPATEEEEFKGAPAGFVPYAALKEARTKYKTLEEVVRGVVPQPAQPAPSAATQPAAEIPAIGTPEHAAYLQDQLQVQALSANLDRSEFKATQAYGADAVKALQEWVGTKDEFWFQRVLQTADPYAVAKAEYDLEQNAKKFETAQPQWEAFLKWQADQAALAAQATATPAAPTAPAVVAPSALAAQQKAQQTPLQPGVSSGSIVDAPSAGGLTPGEISSEPGTAFASAFDK